MLKYWSSPEAYISMRYLVSPALRYLFWSLTKIRWSSTTEVTHPKTVMGHSSATLINAFSRDSLRCALFGFFFLYACTLSPYYLPLSFTFLFSHTLSFIFSLSHVASLPYVSRSISLWLSVYPTGASIYICLSVPPMCCLCVYTCDERVAFNNMHYGREWMEL